MPAHKIDCQHCGENVWAFHKCEVKEKRQNTAPPVHWGKSMENSQIFGDRVDSFEVLGGQNLVLRKGNDG